MKKLLLLLSIAIIAISCTKQPVVPPTPPETLKSITLSADSLDVTLGATKQLVFTLNPSDFSVKSIVFSSSDSTTVSVSSAGLLTAKKLGLVVITVANQGNTISVDCLVRVLPKPVTPVVDSLKVGLIAFYPFSYDSAVDSSGNGNNGTIYNMTSIPDRFGKVNSAYYFDGFSSYIDIKDNNALRLSGTDFTINYWVNLTSYIYASGSAVLAKNNGPNQQGWNSSITGNNFAFGSAGHAFYNVSGGDDPFAFGSKTIPIGHWTMVTVLYSLSKKQISFYINGVLDNTTSNIPTPNANTNVDMFIGKDSYIDPSGQTPPYFINGGLDDIRIYTRMLNNGDIQKLFNLTH